MPDEDAGQSQLKWRAEDEDGVEEEEESLGLLAGGGVDPPSLSDEPRAARISLDESYQKKNSKGEDNLSICKSIFSSLSSTVKKLLVLPCGKEKKGNTIPTTVA